MAQKLRNDFRLPSSLERKLKASSLASLDQIVKPADIVGSYFRRRLTGGITSSIMTLVCVYGILYVVMLYRMQIQIFQVLKHDFPLASC